MYCVAAEARAAAGFYAELFSRELQGSDTLGWRVSPAQVQLVVFTPSAWQDRFGLTVARDGFQGYALRSRDLATTLAVMREAGVRPVRLADGSALLSPSAMVGNAVDVMELY